MFFWNSLAFSIIQRMLAIWSLVLLPFLNLAWTSGSSQIMYYWSLAWRILSIALLACEMSAIVQQFEHSPSLGLEWKWTFSSPIATAEISRFAGILKCSTIIGSSFRIWNSSTEIPSSPLAMFIVMLLKAHLTLHSRTSGSRWMITPSWLSGSLRSFLYSSFLYCYHLFLVSSAFVRSILFLSFIVPIFAWNVTCLGEIYTLETQGKARIDT